MASRLLWASRAASYLRISVSHRGFATGVRTKPIAIKNFWDKIDHKKILGTKLNIDVKFEDIKVLKDLKYLESHEWVKVDGNSATVGITDHAQDHLGDVVYVELPEVGATVTHGGSFGAVESVKATSDINSPVSGKVVEVNENLSDSPGLVNSSPFEKGWIIKVELNDSGELNKLMDSEQYSKFCDEEDSKH